MTITDNSLPNELERDLLQPAAAMCVWQVWMVWDQGGRTSPFRKSIGNIGQVFSREAARGPSFKARFATRQAVK